VHPTAAVYLQCALIPDHRTLYSLLQVSQPVIRDQV